jgi:hypothetical protein
MMRIACCRRKIDAKNRKRYVLAFVVHERGRSEAALSTFVIPERSRPKAVAETLESMPE